MARKQVYRPRNWSDYNKNLIRRGDITLWIYENVSMVVMNAQRPAVKELPIPIPIWRFSAQPRSDSYINCLLGRLKDS